jgi:hypothetical protein
MMGVVLYAGAAGTTRAGFHCWCTTERGGGVLKSTPLREP